MGSVREIWCQVSDAEREQHLIRFMQRRRAEQLAALAEPARLPRAADGILVGFLLSLLITLAVWVGFSAFAAAVELGM